MKYICIADLHCKIRGYEQVVDGIPESLYYPLENLRKAALKAKEENATLIILGDIIHDKYRLSPISLSYIYQYFEEIDSYKIDTVLIAGNHDYIEYNNRYVSWLEGLKFSNIQIVLPNQYETLGNVLFLSNGSIETMQESIENCLEDYILFGHFGLYEASLSGTEFKTGEFTIKQLSKFKKVILGHIHKPQQISNVIYVGSVIPTTISEYSEQKHFIIYDDESNEITEVNTEYPKTNDIKVDKQEDINITDIEEAIKCGNKYRVEISSTLEITEKLDNLQKKYPGYINVKKNNQIEKNGLKISDITTITIDNIIERLVEIQGLPKSKEPLLKLLAKSLITGELNGKSS